MAEHARGFTTQEVLRLMKAFNAAAVDTRGGWQPSLSLELAVAEVLEAPAQAPMIAQEEKPSQAKVDKSRAQETRPEKITTSGAEPKARPESAVKTAKQDAPAELGTAKPEAISKPEPSAIISHEKVKTSKNDLAGIGVADVIKAWRDIRSLVKPDHPSIEALLNSCKPLDVRGNQLFLGFQSNKVRELFDIRKSCCCTPGNYRCFQEWT